MKIFAFWQYANWYYTPKMMTRKLLTD